MKKTKVECTLVEEVLRLWLKVDSEVAHIFYGDTHEEIAQQVVERHLSLKTLPSQVYLSRSSYLQYGDQKFWLGGTVLPHSELQRVVDLISSLEKR
jgi:hypothetical protein